MKDEKPKPKVERAVQGSLIEAISMSLERFNGNLSDERKVRLFAMNHAELRALAASVESSRTGMKAISLIVAAITASEQDRKQN